MVLFGVGVSEGHTGTVYRYWEDGRGTKSAERAQLRAGGGPCRVAETAADLDTLAEATGWLAPRVVDRRFATRRWLAVATFPRLGVAPAAALLCSGEVVACRRRRRLGPGARCAGSARRPQTPP
jgi:hypothetical protein